MRLPKRKDPPALLTHQPPDDARTLAYCRVSTEDQAKPDRASLPDQERRCRAFAERHGRAVDYVWADEGVSGRVEARLERLVAWCAAHPRLPGGGLIACLDADRWGRFQNPHASDFFKYQLQRAGWVVDFVNSPASGNRMADQLVGVIHDSRAWGESERLEQRARMGMRHWFEKGYWQGRPPFGYGRVAVQEGTARERRLAPYEHSAGGERVRLVAGEASDVGTVRQVFRWYAERLTLEQIATRLNAKGTPGPFDRYPRKWTQRGTRQRWNEHNVRAILRNPVYAGHGIFGRNAKAEVRQAHGLIEHEGKIPALVDRAVWTQVQAMFARRVGTRPREVVSYLLRGIPQCACGARIVGGGGTRYWCTDCGARVRSKDKGRRKHSDGTPACQACGGHRTAPDLACTFYKCMQCRHPAFTVNAPWLDRTVLREVTRNAKHALRTGAFDRALDAACAARRSGTAQKDAAESLRNLTAARDRLVDAVADGTFSKEQARARLTEIERSLTAIEAEQQQGRFAERRWTLTREERARLHSMAADIEDRLTQASPEAVGDLVAPWIVGLQLNPKTRTGKLVLRRAPIVGLDSKHSAVRSAKGWGVKTPPSLRNPAGVPACSSR